jgi:hypothetical protein
MTRSSTWRTTSRLRRQRATGAATRSGRSLSLLSLAGWGVLHLRLGGGVDLLRRQQHSGVDRDGTRAADRQGHCRRGGVVGEVDDGEGVRAAEREVVSLERPPTLSTAAWAAALRAEPPFASTPFTPSTVKLAWSRYLGIVDPRVVRARIVGCQRFGPDRTDRGSIWACGVIPLASVLSFGGSADRTTPT